MYPDTVTNLEITEVIQHVQSACISLKQYALNPQYKHTAAVEIAGGARSDGILFNTSVALQTKR